MKAFFGNICLAAIGLAATLTLKEWVQIFAGVATGAYFTVATILAIRNRNRRK